MYQYNNSIDYFDSSFFPTIQETQIKKEFCKSIAPLQSIEIQESEEIETQPIQQPMILFREQNTELLMNNIFLPFLNLTFDEQINSVDIQINYLRNSKMSFQEIPKETKQTIISKLIFCKIKSLMRIENPTHIEILEGLSLKEATVMVQYIVKEADRITFLLINEFAFQFDWIAKILIDESQFYKKIKEMYELLQQNLSKVESVDYNSQQPSLENIFSEFFSLAENEKLKQIDWCVNFFWKNYQDFQNIDKQTKKSILCQIIQLKTKHSQKTLNQYSYKSLLNFDFRETKTKILQFQDEIVRIITMDIENDLLDLHKAAEIIVDEDEFYFQIINAKGFLCSIVKKSTNGSFEQLLWNKQKHTEFELLKMCKSMGNEFKLMHSQMIWDVLKRYLSTSQVVFDKLDKRKCSANTFYNQIYHYLENVKLNTSDFNRFIRILFDQEFYSIEECLEILSNEDDFIEFLEEANDYFNGNLYANIY